MSAQEERRRKADDLERILLDNQRKVRCCLKCTCIVTMQPNAIGPRPYSWHSAVFTNQFMFSFLNVDCVPNLADPLAVFNRTLDTRLFLSHTGLGTWVEFIAQLNAGPGASVAYGPRGRNIELLLFQVGRGSVSVPQKILVSV